MMPESTLVKKNLMSDRNCSVMMFLLLALYSIIPAKLAGWTTTTALPDVRDLPTSVVYNGYIYVIGGRDSFTVQGTVYYALLNANGTVGTWDTTTALPSVRIVHTSVAYNGYVYVIGGVDGSFSAQSTVYYAPLNANGTVGAWDTTTSLPDVRSYPTSVVYNGYVYTIGGWDNGFAIQSTVYYAPLNANGTVGTWNTTTALPDVRGDHSSVIYNGYVYVIGGWNGRAQSTVYYAQLDTTNGTVGPWNTTTSLPDTICDHTSVVCNGYVYTIGGEFGNDVSAQNTVYYALLNANGTVGLWDTTTSLPAPREEHASVGYNNYIYVIGGHSTTGLGTIYNTVWYSQCDTSNAVESMDGNYGKISISCVPNPFTQKTVIAFRSSGISGLKDLKVQVYDLSGRLVKVFPLIPNPQSPMTAITWDGKDNSGNKLSKGIYFVSVFTNDFKLTRKVTLLK